MKKLLLLLVATGCCSINVYAAKLKHQPNSDYPITKQLLSQQFSLMEIKDLKVWTYFKDLFPSTAINSIYNTPYKNTYAILAGQNIFYGTIGSPFIMVGHLFNPYTQQDLTAEIEQLKIQNQKIDISKIDISDAIVTKAKNNVSGKKMIVFEDPDCPYCRVLETQLQSSGLDNKIDIYHILLPLPMHPNAKNHIQNVYCTKKDNSIEVLDKYMINGDDKQEVKIKDGCNIEKILERTGKTVRELGINATPTIILGNGRMIQGADNNAIAEYVIGDKQLPKIDASSSK
jgi:thiol:disulfide interchange protein DsbC